MSEGSDAAECREHAQYYRKLAEIVGDASMAEMYRQLAEALDAEAEELSSRDDG